MPHSQSGTHLPASKNIEVAIRMRPLLDVYEDNECWIANSQQKTITSIPISTNKKASSAINNSLMNMSTLNISQSNITTETNINANHNNTMNNPYSDDCSFVSSSNGNGTIATTNGGNSYQKRLLRQPLQQLPSHCSSSSLAMGHNGNHINTSSSSMIIPSLDKNQNNPNGIYEFNYDYVFSTEQNNQQIYEQSCKKIVEGFTNDHKNASIFMYGQTTSGKTYTMLGSDHEEGLIIFSLKEIFSHRSQKEKSRGTEANSKLHGLTEADFQKRIYISYMQIYNEQINDLLNPEGLNLKISDDTVIGLSEYCVNTYEEALQLLSEGEKLRSYSEKSFHDHSSRSHTIFQIKIVHEEPSSQGWNQRSTAQNCRSFSLKSKANRSNSKRTSVLNLVDLAGSQRVTEDDDTNQETGYINKSLFVLSNVIHKLSSLSSKKKSNAANQHIHIPFRDSKLTRVLSTSLTTNSSTIFICTISPAEINFTQTLSTLRFANQSRKVELKSVGGHGSKRNKAVNGSDGQSKFKEMDINRDDWNFGKENEEFLKMKARVKEQQRQILRLKEENERLRLGGAQGVLAMGKLQSSNSEVHQTRAIATTTNHSFGDISNMLHKLSKIIGTCEDSSVNKENSLSINSLYDRRMIKTATKNQRQQKCQQKLESLSKEFQGNVENLQQQYIKAMINLTSAQMGVSKAQLMSRLETEKTRN